jgi:hypothetical protein
MRSWARCICKFATCAEKESMRPSSKTIKNPVQGVR